MINNANIIRMNNSIKLNIVKYHSLFITNRIKRARFESLLVVLG